MQGNKVTKPRKQEGDQKRQKCRPMNSAWQVKVPQKKVVWLLLHVPGGPRPWVGLGQVAVLCKDSVQVQGRVLEYLETGPSLGPKSPFHPSFLIYFTHSPSSIFSSLFLLLANEPFLTALAFSISLLPHTASTQDSPH